MFHSVSKIIHALKDASLAGKTAMLEAIEAVKRYMYQDRYQGPGGPTPTLLELGELVGALRRGAIAASLMVDIRPLQEFYDLEIRITGSITSGFIPPGHPTPAERGEAAYKADLTLNELKAWLTTQPAALSTVGDWGSRLRLRIEGSIVLLDGQPVPLDMTSERREEVLCYLGHLLGAAPHRISDSEVDRAEEQKKGGLTGIRWDQVRKKLPSCLRQLIETDQRKGSRLIPTLYERR